MSVLLDRKFPVSGAMPKPAVSTTTTPLADALRELDIVPFDSQTVAAYKQDKMDRICARRTRGMVQFTPEPWDSFAGEVYASAIRLATQAGRNYGDRENTMLRFYTYQIPTYVPADARVFLPPLAMALVWDLVEHPGVPAEMPIHVERKARQIAEAVPGVTFETETLRDHSHQYDPFLVVRLGNERYYVEVWDERDFEKSV